MRNPHDSRLSRLNRLAERCWDISNIHAAAAAMNLLDERDDAARDNAETFKHHRDRWRCLSDATMAEYEGSK